MYIFRANQNILCCHFQVVGNLKREDFSFIFCKHQQFLTNQREFLTLSLSFHDD